ncbi:hypothetical protein [Salinisphaera sp. G21_0]|uniref:hypothetical protein n=1 Tax=Salinisphaera sp. G21_0 TaxID=2821094 RepID=UPI001AD9C374|nr:hypothetical protein [Salinisphaera sp. G21_0]MBO9483393.1 hypothetical protein [Salinisphaera sp. G21_0]
MVNSAGKKVRWARKCPDRFKYRILKLTSRRWGVSMQYRLHKLAQYTRGWGGISDYRNITDQFPCWINGYVGESVAVFSSNGASRKPVSRIWSG